jgi:hypothetical protein
MSLRTPPVIPLTVSQWQPYQFLTLHLNDSSTLEEVMRSNRDSKGLVPGASATNAAVPSVTHLTHAPFSQV